MSLNYTEEQNRIFDFIKSSTGNGIIDAVAGAGKTTTIIECAKFLPYKTDILFCAFNASIANEIKQKLKQKGILNFEVKTLHSLGRQLLVENNSSGKQLVVHMNKYQLIIDSNSVAEDIQNYLGSILERKRSKKSRDEIIDELEEIKKMKARLLDIVDKMRNTLTTDNFNDFRIMVSHYNIFSEYETEKIDYDADLRAYFNCSSIVLNEGNILAERDMVVDFTDMLYLPNKRNFFPIKKYDFMFIDECQDLSKSQLHIALRFRKSNGRILSVGDPKQSIYGFTGADVNSFTNIENLTNAERLELTSSFRCPLKVITLAQGIRSDITSKRNEEGLISNIRFEDVLKFSSPMSLIISRFKSPLYVLALKFILENREIAMHEDEIKELSNDLKSLFIFSDLNNPISRITDMAAFLNNRIYTRISQLIRSNAEIINDRIEKEKHIANELLLLNEKIKLLTLLLTKSSNSHNTIREVIDNLKVFFSKNSDAIRIMSIHKSKGLESQNVFILDYSELPYKRTTHKSWESEQEMNLKYVAITRSLQNLYLVKTIQ